MQKSFGWILSHISRHFHEPNRQQSHCPAIYKEKVKNIAAKQGRTLMMFGKRLCWKGGLLDLQPHHIELILFLKVQCVCSAI